jgi:glutaminase
MWSSGHFLLSTEAGEMERQEGTAGGLSLAPAWEEPAGVFRSPIESLLDDLLERHAPLDDGLVASYIPELAGASSDLFAIVVATTDGSIYEAGDARVLFTLQSISKPLTYALALERLGADVVHARIGVEPSGDAFNSIALAPGSGMPSNAMVNAGAIAAASLVAETLPFDEVLAAYGQFAGRSLDVDEQVYLSERETGHRNRAIAHLLRTFDIVGGNPEVGLDFYFRQCAVAVDCRDLALIGATLANGGVHPHTRERVMARGAVREVLSVMASCGMYDGAGAWMTEIGLPAKSGVSGGILAVLPGRLAVACYSPPLDGHGNSVRGVAVCRELSERIGLHLVRPGERPPSPVRAVLDLARTSSKRARPPRERAALAAVGGRVAIVELQGELGFGGIEAVSRLVADRLGALESLVLDVTRVAWVDPAGRFLLAELTAALGKAFIDIAVCGRPDPAVAAALGVALPLLSLDLALERCEDELLRQAGATGTDEAVTAKEHAFIAELPENDRATVLALLQARRYPAGAVVVERGAPADELFLVLGGRLSVMDDSGDDPPRRVATVPAGGLFGELGVALGGVRTATVNADTDVDVLVLSRDALYELRDRQPRAYAAALEQLLVSVARTASRLDREVAALA